MDGGAWRVTVHGVTKSQAQLTHSSQFFIRQFTDFHFNYWSTLCFFWFYYVYLFFYDHNILALMFAHLSEWSPLPDFIGLFWQRKTFTSLFAWGNWMGLLIVFVGRHSLLLRSPGWWGPYPYCEATGEFPLAGLCSWVGHLASLHIVVGPLNGHPGGIGMLAGFHGQMGPLAGFWSYLW